MECLQSTPWRKIIRPCAAATWIFLAFLLSATICRADDASAEKRPPRSSVEYEIEVDGEVDKDIMEIIEGNTVLFTKQDDPPASFGRLRKRAEEELLFVRKVFQSKGRFKAQVNVAVREAEDDDDEKAVVILIVDQGPLFLFDDVEIRATGNATGELGQTVQAPDNENLGITVGLPYDADAVLNADDKLLAYYQERSRPFVEIGKRNIIVDHAAEEVTVQYGINVGPEAYFGETVFTGLNDVEAEYIQNLIPWQEGDPYKASLLEKFTDAALSSGLFTFADVLPLELPGDDGRVPIRVNFKERKHKTWRAGVEYTTDYGPGLNLGYEHRNLLGEGERLNTSLRLNGSQQLLSSTFREPFFYRTDQSLIIKADAGLEDLEAFESKSVEVSAVVEREIYDDLTAGLGLGWRFSDVLDRENDERDRFSLVFVPSTLAWDKRNSVLDPTSGFSLTLAATPYFDVLGSEGSRNFVSAISEGTYHFPVLENDRWVLSARAKYGIIKGPDREDIPADLRLYAGGGGSIRGYTFQTAGELDEDDNPIGGKAVFDYSLESRVKVTEDIGIVVFFDAGRYFSDDLVDFSEDFFRGVGLGLRYDVGFGPLRLDLGFPLDRRKDIDDPVSVYIGIGQAF